MVWGKSGDTINPLVNEDRPLYHLKQQASAEGHSTAIPNEGYKRIISYCLWG